MKPELKKLLVLNLPYLLFVYLFAKCGQTYRLSAGADASAKLLHLTSGISAAFASPLPSLHPFDLCVGVVGAVAVRLIVYSKGKNAKKYRKGEEYGSARWGTAKDIEPFMAPKFADNIILTKTERLMMSNRPPDPKNARNKNVLVVGGSGSGKTRFWLKPNLLQCHSSYVVTDPKGTIVLECGNAMLKNNYAKTRPVYDAYRKSGYSKKFLEAHREEITLHKAAKAAFDEAGLQKLPKVKELDAEFSELLTKKKAAYPDYRKARNEMQELVRAQKNVERFFAEEKTVQENEQAR